MEALKLKRAGLRSSFTKTANALKSELARVDVDISVVKVKFSKLQGLQTMLKELDGQILDLLAAGERTSEEDIVTEIEGREVYSDEFLTLTQHVDDKVKLSEEIANEGRSEVGCSISENKLKSYRLPKIELKKFDGELLNWLPFWSQFQKIHEDRDLHECDKFSYLVQSMKPGSRAKDFIDSYPVTSDNYDSAVAALKERFGNSDLLIEVYVRELIKLIISNVKAEGKDRLPLDKLYDRIEAQLRALESLGLKPEENSSWLYPMVESSMDEEVHKAWQRSSLFNQGEGNKLARLSNLMKFLKSEVEGEERLKLARRGFESASGREGYRPKTKGEPRNKFGFNKSVNIPTAAGLLVTKERSCIFCSKSHESRACTAARHMTLDDKISKIKEKKCCLKCLEPHHVAKFCGRNIRCYACGRAHPICLCPDMHHKIELPKEDPMAEKVQTTTVGQACTAEIVLMTLRVKVRGVKGTRDVRALLDCGSQKSYILGSVAVELGLPIISRETVTHTLFGGAKTDPKLHNKYRVKLSASNRRGYPEFEFEFLDQDVICGAIQCIPKGPILKELKRHSIWLSDMGPGCPQVEMLIGSDIYGKILTGLVKQLKGGLTAVSTKLGWAVCGKLEEFPTSVVENSSIMCASLAVRDFKISDLWNLEAIGILDSHQALTKEAEAELALEQFSHTLSRNADGRYCVGLPWLVRNVELPSNRQVAEKRLFSVTRKLKSLNRCADYDRVFKEWLEEGVIEVVSGEEITYEGHYLPHHPVFKPDSATTKVRPVFDASCKTGRSPSLNDCLFKGPNLIEEIPSLLLRFREKRIGVTSDIKRAFLQIELRKEDRDFLRFLWWENDNVIRVLRHTRVVFGVTSSPFLLGAVIAHHLSEVPEEETSLARKLAKSFYVDNCVTSVDNEEELQTFVRYSIDIMAQARMDLRMWTFSPLEDDLPLEQECSNPESDLSNTVSVLGIFWHRKEDGLSVGVKTAAISDKLSKRKILSLTQAVFDPLGFLTPVLLQTKLLLQEIWTLKVDWDAPLPEKVVNKFLRWYRELPILANLKIPRRIGYGDKKLWTFHVFCDSSQNAYSTVIFLRCELDGKVFVSFVAAKSRVAPLKAMTIPRLELMACVLGVRLSKYVTEALLIEDAPIYFWTDSTTALHWIKRNNLWGTFVGNRVREICTATKTNQWAYVPGDCNPADLPSRGCSPVRFAESDWWKGPRWLKESSNCWPKLSVEPDGASVFSEVRRGGESSVHAGVVESVEPKWYERLSSFSKMIRVLGWIRRFVRNCRKQCLEGERFLSASEMREAKIALILLVQRESFPVSERTVQGLVTERDQDGVLRVKTKILDREDEYSFRFPILLPSKHYVVQCCIRDYHLKYSHAGIQILMSILREEYWILSARRSIRSVVKRCVRCKRFTAKPPTTAPIQLPADRVRDASTFEVTGIDLCGPLILRNKTKTWIVLFTCAVYRCIHLELVSSISTEYFLQALRRFIARRGRPSVIYTDNGTNFVGASAALKKVNWDKIVAQDTLEPIQWNFIPPTAAWWGGWWERLIRTTKNLLVRILGQASINYEELLTIICDVESVMNCRPLTYVSSETQDLQPLTPAMFLRDIRGSGTADLDYVEQSKLLVRQKYCQELREQLRSRFRQEYLGQLVQKHGQKHCDLKVGDLVLVGSENCKRIGWPIARIQELCPGRDSKVRVAKVKTRNGVLVRPVRKLYPLEICSCTKDPMV